MQTGVASKLRCLPGHLASGILKSRMGLAPSGFEASQIRMLEEHDHQQTHEGCCAAWGWRVSAGCCLQTKAVG